MIRRTMDATLINMVANDPEVRPWIGGAGELDLSEVVANPLNITLEADHGAFWLQSKGGGIYELHTLFLPSGRGKPFFQAAREMFRYVFTQSDAVEIITQCPDDNLGAGMAAGVVGFRERFRREDAWAADVGISYRVFDIDSWVMRDREALRAGREFHETLEAAKRENGSELPTHPDDETHDRYAGAAVLIAEYDTPKAVRLYNRFATFTGYAPIAYVGNRTIDVQDAVVQVIQGRTEVLLCR